MLKCLLSATLIEGEVGEAPVGAGEGGVVVDSFKKLPGAFKQSLAFRHVAVTGGNCAQGEERESDAADVACFLTEDEALLR